MKKIILLIVLLLVMQLWSQVTPRLSKSPGSAPAGAYDEKEIMKKQAERYTAQRKYEKANLIYSELIEKYPEDWQIVEALLNNLMRVSSFEQAGKLLEEKKGIIPEYNYLRLKIPMLLKDGNTKAAFQLGDDYLQNNKNNVNVYQDMSQIYSGSRQFEKAAEVLLKVRNVTKDDYLFTLDLARNYQSEEKNDLAAEEYLKHLEKNANYLHYVMNNLKGMLNRDKNVIKTVKKVRDSSDNKEVMEAYALCLAYIDDYDEALLQYQELEDIKLLDFAEELYKMGNYAIALKAYDQYENRVDEPDLQSEAQIAKAEIYLKQRDYQQAETELMLVYNNKKILQGKYRYRTQTAKSARLLLADLTMRLDRPAEDVIKYLEEAAKFTLNDKERKEIEFSIIDYHIKSGDFQAAGEQLGKLLKTEEPGTDIFKQSIYYTWQIALMQKDTLADSLLGELILNQPDSRLTTQALYLTQIMTSLPEEFHERLYEAWRLQGLYKTQAALAILNDIFELSGNDEIQLLAAEWEEDDLSLSIFWWQQEFENELLSEYAAMQIMENTASDSLKQEIITDFLKENPQSVFAPRFRNELTRLLAGGK